ncbi:MAG TPA: RloB domain-containing protein [Bacilli bacterium]|nr:RloB domain-containing protein [Bacilli bacterium]
MDNITIRIIKREQEFKNVLKDAKKKINRKKYQYDHFIAIFDGDIDYNDREHSLNNRCKAIESLAQDSQVKIIISNRCWENWIALHFEKFNRFTEPGTIFPIPNYEKSKPWYHNNFATLYEKTDTAIENSQWLRKMKYQDMQFNQDIKQNPNYKDKQEISTVLSMNPVTYVDLLILFLRKVNSE